MYMCETWFVYILHKCSRFKKGVYIVLFRLFYLNLIIIILSHLHAWNDELLMQFESRSFLTILLVYEFDLADSSYFLFPSFELHCIIFNILKESIWLNSLSLFCFNFVVSFLFVFNRYEEWLSGMLMTTEEDMIF